jgi:hypothetical protein
MQFDSDRYFQIWDYHVSHARVLIRSASPSDSSKNIDIIFYAVDYLGIPSCFEGLTLSSVLMEEAIRAGAPADELGRSTAFRLETGDRAYFVIALACRVLENDLDLFDSSIGEIGAGERRRDDLGRILAHS